MKNFILGFKSAFSGFSIIKNPKIRPAILLPSLICIFIFALTLWFGFSKINYFGDALDNILPSFLGWLATFLKFLLSPLFIIIAFYLAAIIANIIASPFNGHLAEKTESLLKGYPPPSNGRKIKKTIMLMHIIKSESKKLAYIVAFSLPLLILSFVPVINIFMPAIWIIVGSWLLAIEYMDYPMGNHNMPFNDQLRLLKAYPMMSLGFGLGVMTITIIPIVNLLTMPVATCSATKIWLDFYENKQLS